MHIMLAESDEPVLQSIELMLRSEHFNVYTTADGMEAIELGKLYDYDLILLGDMTDVSFHDVLKQIRSKKVRTPVLVVSELVFIGDKVKALDTGADDYLARPFHKDELVARIRAIVRRAKGHAASILVSDNLKLDLNARTAEVAGTPVHLTGKEYLMLELLMLRQGQTVTREMMMNHLYGLPQDEPELKIIDVFLCKIRRKLAAAGALDLIETVWGRGYLIRKPGEVAPSLAPELRQMAGLGVKGGETLHRDGSLRMGGAA